MMPPPNRTAVIIRRVEQLAERREVTMTEISLAWLLTKTAPPVVGATKLQHIEEMVGAAGALSFRRGNCFRRKLTCRISLWA